TAASSLLWLERNASTASSHALIQSAGSCSDQPSCGRETDKDAVADAITFWLPSISSALTPDVPRSSPRYILIPPAPAENGRHGGELSASPIYFAIRKKSKFSSPSP